MGVGEPDLNNVGPCGDAAYVGRGNTSLSIRVSESDLASEQPLSSPVRRTLVPAATVLCLDHAPT
jgi:hypothetical protein